MVIHVYDIHVYDIYIHGINIIDIIYSIHIYISTWITINHLDIGITYQIPEYKGWLHLCGQVIAIRRYVYYADTPLVSGNMCVCIVYILCVCMSIIYV